MRLQQNGDMAVSIGETVTVEIAAQDTAFLAHTSSILTGQWQSAVHPDSVSEARIFVVSDKFSHVFHFTIGFDFSPGKSGKIAATARYDVRISGDGQGGYVRQRPVKPISTPPTSLVFSFEVGQG